MKRIIPIEGRNEDGTFKKSYSGNPRGKLANQLKPPKAGTLKGLMLDGLRNRIKRYFQELDTLEGKEFVDAYGRAANQFKELNYTEVLSADQLGELSRLLAGGATDEEVTEKLHSFTRYN